MLQMALLHMDVFILVLIQNILPALDSLISYLYFGSKLFEIFSLILLFFQMHRILQEHGIMSVKGTSLLEIFMVVSIGEQSKRIELSLQIKTLNLFK